MEKKTTGTVITKNFAKKMETISPFELKNKLIEMADESIKKMAHTMLNAGRGNPNWIATEPREAFFLLGKFGLCECRRVQSLEDVYKRQTGFSCIPRCTGRTVGTRNRCQSRSFRRNPATRIQGICLSLIHI